MAIKKILPRSPRPDRYSTKKTGFVKQSVRLTVSDNKLVRDAASKKNQSINGWLSTVILAAAREQATQ